MEVKKLNKKDYTADSWKVFSDALKTAQFVYDDENATEKEIVDVLKELKDAQSKLVKVGEEQSHNKFDTKPNTPVKTGDVAPIFPLTIMGVGAVLVVLFRKRR